MKTYTETISKISMSVFHSLMGGGYGEHDGAELVSYIFGKTPAQVGRDINKQVDLLFKEQSESIVRNKNMVM